MRTSLRTAFWLTMRRWTQRLSLAHCKAIAAAVVADDAVVARAHRWDALTAATRWDVRLSLALCKANVTVVDDAVVARAHRWDALAAATRWDQRLSLAI